MCYMCYFSSSKCFDETENYWIFVGVFKKPNWTIKLLSLRSFGFKIRSYTIIGLQIP